MLKQAEHGGQRSSLRRFGLRLGLLLASIVLALGVGEGIVRLVAPQPLKVPMFDSLNGLICMKANVNGRCYVPGVWDVRIRTNSQRFRATRDYQLDPPPNTIRIAVLGDSVTFGMGADDDQTYPVFLERALEERVAGAKSVEVLNVGVGGTATGNQALLFELMVKQFKPHLVILSVHSNDAEDDLSNRCFILGEDGRALPRPPDQLALESEKVNLMRRFTRMIPAYDFLTQHLHLLNLVRESTMKLLNRNSRSQRQAGRGPQREERIQRILDEALPLMAAEVRWLGERVKSSGARLAVLYLPPREKFYSDPVPWYESEKLFSDAVAAMLARTCKEQDLPYADLTPVMHAECKRSERDLYASGGDTHPRPDGYRVYGRAAANFLFERGLVKP